MPLENVTGKSRGNLLASDLQVISFFFHKKYWILFENICWLHIVHSLAFIFNGWKSWCANLTVIFQSSALTFFDCKYSESPFQIRSFQLFDSADKCIRQKNHLLCSVRPKPKPKCQIFNRKFCTSKYLEVLKVWKLNCAVVHIEQIVYLHTKDWRKIQNIPYLHLNSSLT